MQQVVIISYRCFRTTYWFHLFPFSFCSWALMMGPIGCPDISVRNYHCSLHNNPKELSSHLLRGGSLKSRKTWRILTLRLLMSYTGCPRRKGQNFGRVFLMLKYTDITQNTYIQSWTVTEIMAREVLNFDSCYTLIDYQIHIKTGRNMWFL